MSDNLDPEFMRHLEAAIANLPTKQREIFLAHRLDGMTYADIAGRTGLTVEKVKRQMANAIYKIAKQMDGRRLCWWERLF